MKKKLSKTEITDKVLKLKTYNELMKFGKTNGIISNERAIEQPGYVLSRFQEATFKKAYNHIWSLCYPAIEKKNNRIVRRRNTKEADKISLYKEINEILIDLAKKPLTPYTKVLTLGNSSIYLASPFYGLKDYNRSYVCSINDLSKGMWTSIKNLQDSILKAKQK